VKKTTGGHWRHPEIIFVFGLLFEVRFISEEQATPEGIFEAHARLVPSDNDRSLGD
jgi:hypothetical protein